MKKNKIVSRLSLRAKFTDGGTSVQVVIIDGKTNAIQIEQIPLNFSTEVVDSQESDKVEEIESNESIDSEVEEIESNESIDSDKEEQVNGD